MLGKEYSTQVMAIERLVIPSGILIPDDSFMSRMIDSIQNGERDSAIVTLEEGEYDLTPPVRRNLLARLNLIVHQDGTATLRQIPISLDPRAQIYSTRYDEHGLVEVKQGGVINRIPDDFAVLPVLGPGFEDDNAYLYNLVFHSSVYTPA